jgi:hypothetical protein
MREKNNKMVMKCKQTSMGILNTNYVDTLSRKHKTPCATFAKLSSAIQSRLLPFRISDMAKVFFFFW